MKRKFNHRKRRKTRVEPLSPLGFRVKKKWSVKQKIVFIIGTPLWVILGLCVVLSRVAKFITKHWKLSLIVLCILLFLVSLVGGFLYLNQSLKKQQETINVMLDNYNAFNTETTNTIEQLKQDYLTQEQQLKDKDSKIEEQQKHIKDLETRNKQLSSRSQVTSRSGSSIQRTSQPVQPKSNLQAYAKSYMLSTYGWGDDQFTSLVNLWNRESGWNPNAHNKSSGAHGIPQALPASKMASFGADYYTNGETQIRWGLSYIKNRYGTPNQAWAWFQSHNWY